MGAAQQVDDNVACVLRALGAATPDPALADLEAKVLPQVLRVLEPIKNGTWVQGNDDLPPDEPVV